MYYEGSLLWAVGLSWVVLAQGPTHSGNQMVAGPRVIIQFLHSHIWSLDWTDWDFEAGRVSLYPRSLSTGHVWDSP